MVSDVILTLIINQTAYLGIAIVQAFNHSNCSKVLCGKCIEVDEYHPKSISKDDLEELPAPPIPLQENKK